VSHHSSTSRWTAIATVLVFVIFFAPYQFVVIIIFISHLLHTGWLLNIANSTSVSFHVSHLSTSLDSFQKKTYKPPHQVNPKHSKVAWDRFNYASAVLVLMLTVLPMNASILLVWVRNMMAGWWAPFSSDHNVLNVLGFVVWYETFRTGTGSLMDLGTSWRYVLIFGEL
jgi:GPI inositol-deacylase